MAAPLPGVEHAICPPLRKKKKKILTAIERKTHPDLDPDATQCCCVSISIAWPEEKVLGRPLTHHSFTTLL